MPNRKGRTQNSKRFVKNVKAIVQEELKDEIEEKHAITEYADVLCQRAIPSGAVTNGAGNFFKILPEIDQSVTGEAARAPRVTARKIRRSYFWARA